MAPLYLFFLFLSALYSNATSQQRANNTIGPNSSLTPTGNAPSWLSPSGLFAFGFYNIRSGYAVGVFMPGIPEKTVVWTANRDNASVPANVTLLITADGRLALQQPLGQDMTNIVSLGEKVSSASMLDSGNFVLYNSANKIIWQSFEHPTDTLLPGMRLAADQQLFSSVSPDDPSTGPFRLIMQEDGTLVQYPTEQPSLAQYAYWSSYTDKNGLLVTLNLDTNGYMYLLKENKTIIFNLTQRYQEEGLIYRATVDVDGIFRLYSISGSFKGTWTLKFQTTADKCDPKGICGFNAYCTIEDTESKCKCLPGFDFVSPDYKTCERNFSTPGCKYPSRVLNFDMEFLGNTLFDNDSYSTAKASTKEECAQACQKDCNCEAVLFKDGACGMQRLPLRYGRRMMDDTTVAGVKIGISEEGSWIDQPSIIYKDKGGHLEMLIMSICLFALSLVILAAVGILMYVKKAMDPKDVSSRSMNNEFIRDVSLRAFTYAELEQATNDFKEELGRGAFGTVYKGTLQNSQRVVAVKRLEQVLTQGGGEREFENEMAVIGRTYHRNLVRLLGYCVDMAKRMLVYEYMSNGSLADVIFVPDKQPGWDERIRIACDIARGILYLHEECDTQIIHCDIKPQNILMDEFYCAKISNSGLAMLLKHDQTKTLAAIRGTKGYVAPEWHQKLPVTVKADVYSFGIVLLEIICLRKNVDWSYPEDEAILEEWAYDAYQAKELGKLIANEEVVDMRKLERIIKIAIWCIQGEPSLRPSMKKVLLMLETEPSVLFLALDIPIPPNPTSFLSTA